MPKLVRKSHVNTQINIEQYWYNIYALLPADDPLRAQVYDMRNEASRHSSDVYYDDEIGDEVAVLDQKNSVKVVNGNGETFKMSNFDLYNGEDSKGITRFVNVEDKQLVGSLKKQLSLLDKIEKKYKDKPEHAYLNNTVKLLKTKEKAALEGIGVLPAPGAMFYKSAKGIQKFQDVILDIEREDKNGSMDIAKYSYKDPVVVEKSLKKFGVLGIMQDFVSLEEHNVQWVKEFNKPVPDLAKMKDLRNKFVSDVRSAEKNILHFEKQFNEDAKKPDDQREIYNFTNHDSVKKGDLIYDVTKPVKDQRALNGVNLDNQKRSFFLDMDRQMTVVELKNIKNTTKPTEETAKLSTMVDAMIDGITWSDYYDSCEIKDRKKKKEIAYSFAVYVQKLMEMKAEAELHPNDPFAAKIQETVKEHLTEPAVLNELSAQENMEAESKVSKIRIDVEDHKVNEQRQELDRIANAKRPEYLSEDEFFDQQREQVIDAMAKMIAIQTAARTVKSMKVGMQEMGETMTQEELSAELDELMSDEYLNAAAEDIKTRDDFNRMAQDIKSTKELNAIIGKAKNGNELLEQLHQAGKQIIIEDTQKARMEMQIEKDRQAQAQKQDPVLGAP